VRATCSVPQAQRVLTWPHWHPHALGGAKARRPHCIYLGVCVYELVSSCQKRDAGAAAKSHEREGRECVGEDEA
jgi:hypothetical protein